MIIIKQRHIHSVVGAVRGVDAKVLMVVDEEPTQAYCTLLVFQHQT